jgi:phenylalanyl-tRNA synthetase beta chain
MKFSEQWLREWVNPSIDTNTLVEQITMAGLEVDGVEPVAASFSGVVVAEISAVAPHPDADKLRVCSVSDGTEEFQVVCGAPNAREGIKIPFAKVGAVLPGNFKIKKAKLRGVESFGMLCAEAELGMSESSDGLMELIDSAPVGQDIREFLSLEDQIIEVDLTPNRSDCLSIAGLAREVGVLNKAPVKGPEINSVAAEVDDTFPVNLAASDACPKYLGRVIKGIDLAAETPLWMKEKLRRCGLRSIDPVVDVTNYILLELGQPMHAFDLNELSGSIVVRYANKDEKLTLLDGQEVALRGDTLVIADENRALAIAGIMGGEASGVSAQTSDVFLECAFFSPIAIAGKARSYGLHTDSSHRFERGVDYTLQHKAIERATALLISIVGGQPGPVQECRDDAHLPSARSVTLRADKLTSLLGVEVPHQETEDILTRLGLGLQSKTNSAWTFDIPSYRFDISIEPDLVEEVGRIYGYNNLPKTHAMGAMVLTPDNEAETATDFIADRLVSLGYQEAITYSFVDGRLQSELDPDGESIALANPISSDMDVMRTSLWTGLLQAVRHNQNRQQSRIKLFETGLKFVRSGSEIEQTRMFSGVISGQAEAENWSNTKRPFDFFDIKADLESILLPIDASIRFEKASHPALHPGQSAQIVKSGEMLGFVGAVHPKLQNSLDLNGPVYMFELCLEKTVKGSVPRFSEVSKFPEVRRDLAIVLRNEVPFKDIETVVRQNAGSDLVNLNVFDVYAGESLGEGQRSIGLGLIWQRVDRTLNDDEINQVFDQIVSALSEKLDARLRS